MTYNYDFSAQATANPWTGPAELLKLFSYPDWQIVNAIGLRSTTAYNRIWFAHNVSYTGGTTEIRAGITTLSTVFSGNSPGAGVFARSGANAGAGYMAYITSATTATVLRVATDGTPTYLGGVTLSGYSAGTLFEIGYTPTGGAIEVYVAGVAQSAGLTDTTYSSDTTLAAGGYLYQNSGVQDQEISTFQGNGIATSGTVYTVTITDGLAMYDGPQKEQLAFYVDNILLDGGDILYREHLYDITDSVLTADIRVSERLIEMINQILLGDLAINDASLIYNISIFDIIYLVDTTNFLRELGLIDDVFTYDTLSLIREMAQNDSIILSDASLLTRVSADIRALVYAKIGHNDLLGITTGWTH